MIIRRETLNEISTLLYNGYTVYGIAEIMNIAVADVIATVKAWKL